MKKLLTVFTLSTLASATYAQSSMDRIDESGLYLGANYGYLKVDGDDDFDDDKDVYQLQAGYQFNRYFALEGSFIDFGEYGNQLATVDTDGYTLGLKGMLPLSERFSLHAKLGQLWYESELNAAGFEDSNDDQGLFAGIGAAYALTPSFSVTFDYTLYDADLDAEEAFDDIDDANFSTDLKQASIGVSYTF